MSTPPEFDIATLERFLRDRLDGMSGPVQVERIAGGQSNPTFFVTSGNHRLVLRKKPPGTLLPSAHAVDREFKVMAALRDSAVPVPKVLLYHTEDDIVGTPFYIMERVEGRMFPSSALPGAEPAARRQMYHAAARTLAALHQVDFSAVGLGDFGKPGSYNARQIARWKRQWALSAAGPNGDVEELISWLETHVPADDTTTLVHGDYRIGNLMFHPTEPRVMAVLDWELSTLGYPMADVAHLCVYSWFMTAAEFGGIRDVELAHHQLPVLSEFAAAYDAEAHSPLRLSTFDLALALFRNAAIFEGIAARARAGNAAAANAHKVGQLAPVLARRAIDLISSST